MAKVEMGVIFKTDKRRIIPRWRSYNIASAAGEVLPVNNSVRTVIATNNAYLKDQVDAWNKNKNLSQAGDLLSSAYVLGIEGNFHEVAKFILDKITDTNSPLTKIAQKTLGINFENISYNSTKETIVEYNSFHFNSEINKLKFLLKREPKNAIAWIELGRNYSLIGQVSKATRCIDNAVFLDKDNRFIVRCASRFYQHFSNDIEKSLFIIKRSSFIKSDPWLISAEIAYSSILNRFSKLVKSGIEYLKRNNENSSSITELASALGTLEFNNGNLKEARKYFKCSLLNPNDNSLAQVSWMSDCLSGLQIENSKYDLPFAFEANALKQYEQQNYQESFNTAILWQNDEPYSTRPIRLASYIASTFLNNNSAAIKLIEKGLSINPDDLTLLNNLVYSLAKENQTEKALKIFEGTLKKHLPEELDKNRIAITATAGLLCYKKNLPEEGKSLYLKAIELAKKLNNDYYLSLATANYLREEIRLVSEKEVLMKYKLELDALSKKTKEPDVLILINEANFELNKVSDSLS